MGQVIAALGFITAVIGPLVQAAGGLSMPPLAQKILAIAGVVVFLAGVAHDAILKWQAAQHTQQQVMVKLGASLKP